MLCTSLVSAFFVVQPQALADRVQKARQKVTSLTLAPRSAFIAEPPRALVGLVRRVRQKDTFWVVE